MRLINNKAGIACIIGFSMLASSCSDWLDPKPLSFYTPENSFINYNGLKTGTDMLNRDVRYFDFYPTAGSADPCILSEYFFSDMSVNGRTDAANSPQDLIRQITPSASLTGNASQINNFWTYLYKGIKDANTLLTRSKTAKFDNEQQRLEIEGLACFHRAYRYYRLVNQFGDIPFITEEVTAPRYDFYTTKREAILRYLKKDLERTAPALSNQVYIGMVTQAAAYHLLTKINLALGEFDDAIESANKVINDGVHSLMTQRFGVDKADPTKNVVWDLHQSDNKSLPENKEVLYMVLDRYDAGEDVRSAAGLEIKRQVLPWYSKDGEIKTPDGKNGFTDNNATKNPYLEEYGRGVCTARSTWYHTHMIWTPDNTDLRHAKGNWIEMTDLVYNNPELEKSNSPWYGKPLQFRDDQGNILVNDTIRDWVGWPHYKTNIADQKDSWWRGGWADWYIFRLAETYLLRAEAYVWKGGIDNLQKAADDVNEVRRRAQASEFTANDMTIRTILDERARELYYEEPRKTELTRIAFIYAKTGIVDDKGRTYDMEHFTEKNFFYDHIMDVTEFYNKGVKTSAGNYYTMAPYHVLWPIALNAISTNVQGHINQTPGYTGSENNIEPLDISFEE